MHGDLFINFECPFCGEITAVHGDYREPEKVKCWNCGQRFTVTVVIEPSGEIKRIEMANALGI